MVDTNQLPLHQTACCAVDDVSVDLPVAINRSCRFVAVRRFLTREILVLYMNMEGVRLLFRCTQLTPQIFSVHPEPQLVDVCCVVPHSVVDIVVRDTGSRAEGNLSAEVGKEVEPVVVVMLRYGQFAVQHHPVDKVGELAQSAADAFRGLAFGDGESLLVAFPPRCSSDAFPYGERLAGTDYQSVDVLDSQREIGRLVLLQHHIDIAEPSADERVMLIDEDGQRRFRSLAGKGRPLQEVLHVSLRDFLLDRQPIGEGRQLTKQFSLHDSYIYDAKIANPLHLRFVFTIIL